MNEYAEFPIHAIADVKKIASDFNIFLCIHSAVSMLSQSLPVRMHTAFK